MLRRWMTGLLVLLLITQGLVPMAAARAGAGEDDANGQTMRVAASSLNLRAGAGTDQSVLRSLPQGTIVTLVETRGEWARVRMEDGTTGWVSAKYLEPAAAPRTPGEAQRPAREPESKPGPDARTAAAGGGSGGGGETLSKIAKWGCLVGAVVVGGLWYTEHSSGNDAYEEYKDLYNDGDLDTAEEKYNEATDHDDKAQTYAIAGGVLLGLFALQQFVLGGGDEDQAAVPAGPLTPRVTWDPASRGVRIALVRAGF